MTTILPNVVPEEDITNGVHALELLLPGRTEAHLRAMVLAVLEGVTHHDRCTSVSPFTHDQCTKDSHRGPRHINGLREWVDGSSVLGGRYSHPTD